MLIAMTPKQLAPIADELGIATGNPASWEVSHDKFNNAYVTRPSDGLAFWFRAGGYGNEGRISIHLNWPHDNKGDAASRWDSKGEKVQCPAITVANTKTPEQIAKDIVRRILPAAVAANAVARANIAATHKFYDGNVEAIYLMAKTLGGEPDRHYQTKELTGEIDPYKCVGIPSFKGAGYGKVKVSGKDSITLELMSMDNATAVAILTAVREVFSKKATTDEN